MSKRLASASLFHICLDANEVSIERLFFKASLPVLGRCDIIGTFVRCGVFCFKSAVVIWRVVWYNGAMRLNYIEADATLAGHDALFGLLKEQDDGVSRHIFIVPDRFTLGVEREICKRYYDEGTFLVDVCSFTRLAQKALGKANKRCLSKEGTVLLLNRVIREHNDELGYYKDVKSVSFSREMFASVASLRSSGITPEDVEEKSKAIEGTVGEKLKDVAILYKAYEEALQSEYFDTITRVDWLINNLQKTFVKDCHIYVLGFNVFSTQQMNFLKRAMLVCPTVSVAFSVTDDEGRGCYPTAQRDELYSYALSSGIEVRERLVHKELEPCFDFLRRNLFTQKKAVFSGNASDRVKVSSYPDSYEEIKAVAKEIHYLTYEKGYRFRDVAVVCNDEKYTPIVRKTFDRYGIKYFIDQKYAVKNCFLARYVNALFAASESGMDVRDVLPLIHHPFSGFTREEIQEFEKQRALLNVNYSAFSRPFENESAEKVRSMTEKRVKSVFKEGKISDYCRLIEEIASEENVQTKAKEYADLAEENSAESVYADGSRFLNVVREIAALCGERIVTAEDFVEMLRSVLENMTVSVLPQYVDTVFVGNTAESRFNDIKVMFVVGASDGYFPMVTGDKLIFGCYDSFLMEKHGLRVFPTPEETNRFEQFEVIDLITKCSYLYLSYATGTADGTPSTQGSGVREIKYYLSLPEKPFIAYHSFYGDESENGVAERLLYEFATTENLFYEYTAGRVPKEYDDCARAFLKEKGFLSEREKGEDDCNLLDGYMTTESGAYKLSVSKMETYFRCPFQNFLKNVLGLQETIKGELQANDKGTIVHAALENYFKAGKKLRSMTEEERFALALSAVEQAVNAPEYERFYETPSGRKEMDDVKRRSLNAVKVLTENMLHSAFTPVYVEKYFSGDELSFIVNDKKFCFSGLIDRVDTDDENDVVIIDYKTGHIESGLQPIFCGEKIQLYVYLKYFINRGYKPLGVFYLPIPDGYAKYSPSFAMEGQRRKGIDALIKLDDRVLNAQIGKYESPNVFFDAKITEDGAEEGGKNKKKMLSEEDFQAVVSYVEKLVTKAVEEIESGYREKKPVQDGCKYCNYKSICGEVSERVGVSEASVSAETFYTKEEEAQG